MDNFLERHEAEHPFPEDVELIRDIDYMGDGMACHFMDIYRGKKHDKKHDKKLPIMFNLHGGGFLLGKKEESHLFCAEMSQKGFLVFSLEYPLAPESLFPQILRDLMKGIKKLLSLGKKEEVAAPLTRKCPYCYGDIDVKATKCMYCTSDVEPTVKAEE